MSERIGTLNTVATARVTLTVEIDVGSTWDDCCPMTQVYAQAENEARCGIERGLEKFGRRARIIGEPKVLAIITERKR